MGEDDSNLPDGRYLESLWYSNIPIMDDVNDSGYFFDWALVVELNSTIPLEEPGVWAIGIGFYSGLSLEE